MAIAIITRGKQAGRRLAIVQWPATIGRDPSASVPIDDDKVSRFHARIKKRDQLYIIEDLQSKNCTYLNGDKITNAVINSGDKVLIGDTEIVFLTPEAQIDVATEMAELEHFASAPELEELGGSIDVGQSPSNDHQTDAVRFSQALEIQSEGLSPEIISRIFEVQSNTLTADNLKDLCASTLKGLHALDPSIARSALFLWTPLSRRLIPLATRHQGQKTNFLINKRAIESVISRKQGLGLNAHANPAQAHSRAIVILPILRLGDLLCIVHLEFDGRDYLVKDELIEPLRFFLERIAPQIDSFMLRQDLEQYSVGMIEAMIATLEAKDTYTHGHSERVSRYSLAIADEMNLDRDVKKLLLMSSLCHDIGKIGIPDAILRKAALLNPDEYEEMKQHPLIGANIADHLPNARRFISGIKYHHEKWDGSGYPDGLAGEDIPFFGRIIAVADVFDAMVSGRSYSGFLDESDAVQRLADEKDLFDPAIVQAFTSAWQSGRLTQKTSTKKNAKPKASGDDT
jgi:HD-GYP domain-containing protein (c-di-GMP phosphodiesterase class II)/fructose-specific component phosphotransferase system IIB-like protein